ncbi:MAG: DUF1992 domain-containing protein [Desulfobacterales bacterium]|nr:DUF1992 domain-containing protein [Desulfobacterales bacterium]
MIPGFEKIVEEKIKSAFKSGEFNNLEGRGKPLSLSDDYYIPEDLRLAFKVLKNSNFLPPEIELKKEIKTIENILEITDDIKEQYNLNKKINFLIMKLNTIKGKSILFDLDQKYMPKLCEKVKINCKKKN